MWDFGDGSATGQTQNANHTYTQTGQFAVTLTIEDAQGNTDQSQQIINVHPPVTADFSMSLDTINLNKGNSVMLTNQSTNEVTYQWNFGNGNTSQFENPTATYNTSGTYTITLTASNAGCQDETEKTIVVINPTGLKQFGEVTVNIYPNPANTQLFIESTDVIKKVDMISLLGEELPTTELEASGRHQIQLLDFPAGIYLLTIITDKGKVTKRLKVSR